MIEPRAAENSSRAGQAYNYSLSKVVPYTFRSVSLVAYPCVFISLLENY